MWKKIWDFSFHFSPHSVSPSCSQRYKDVLGGRMVASSIWWHWSVVSAVPTLTFLAPTGKEETTGGRHEGGAGAWKQHPETFWGQRTCCQELTSSNTPQGGFPTSLFRTESSFLLPSSPSPQSIWPSWLFTPVALLSDQTGVQRKQFTIPFHGSTCAWSVEVFLSTIVVGTHLLTDPHGKQFSVMADLQCGVNFCSTARWLVIYILFMFFPLWFISEDWTY